MMFLKSFKLPLVILDLRKTSQHPGLSSTNSEARFSDGGDAVASLTAENGVMGGDSGSGGAGILGKSSLYYLLIFGSILLLAVATYSYTKNDIKAHISYDKNITNTDESVRPDDNISTYQVAPDLPRIISIPSINVKAKVISVGAKANGEILTPDNIYDAAWFNKSAKPGQLGASLIDGHVSGSTKPGIFYNLHQLKPADAIQIELGSGQILTYKVVKTVIYDSNSVDMDALLSSIYPNTSGLNLITCAGSIDNKTGSFTQRLAVFTTIN
jgi:LPXTG-site transpeptidase (sortase) family protein